MDYVTPPTTTVSSGSTEDTTLNSLDDIAIPADCLPPTNADGSPDYDCSTTTAQQAWINFCQFAAENPNDNLVPLTITEVWVPYASQWETANNYSDGGALEDLIMDTTGEGGVSVVTLSSNACAELLADNIATSGDYSTTSEEEEAMINEFGAEMDQGFSGVSSSDALYQMMESSVAANTTNTNATWGSNSTGDSEFSFLNSEVAAGYDLADLQFVASGNWATEFMTSSNLSHQETVFLQNKDDAILASGTNCPVLMMLIAYYEMTGDIELGDTEQSSNAINNNAVVSESVTQVQNDNTALENDATAVDTDGAATGSALSTEDADAASLQSDLSFSQLLVANTYAESGSSAAISGYLSSFGSTTISSQDTDVTISGSSADDVAIAYNEQVYNAANPYDSSGDTNSYSSTDSNTITSMKGYLTSSGTETTSIGTSDTTLMQTDGTLYEDIETFFSKFLTSVAGSGGIEATSQGNQISS